MLLQAAWILTNRMNGPRAIIWAPSQTKVEYFLSFFLSLPLAKIFEHSGI